MVWKAPFSSPTNLGIAMCVPIFRPFRLASTDSIFTEPATFAEMDVKERVTTTIRANLNATEVLRRRKANGILAT
jgi:hypothetical protein